jgi:hypothetical protein
MKKKKGMLELGILKMCVPHNPKINRKIFRIAKTGSRVPVGSGKRARGR